MGSSEGKWNVGDTAMLAVAGLAAWTAWAAPLALLVGVVVCAAATGLVLATASGERARARGAVKGGQGR